MQVLSLGAGVQSTVLLMLSAQGELPKLDAAIFADTGWEPKAVYEHLERLEAEVAKPAGIPIHRVSVGNIRNDALDPDHRFASMPLFVKNPDGALGMARRQCTAEYKVRPIKEQVRRLLGAKDKDNGRPGNPPKGAHVTQWIGVRTDGFPRAKDYDVGYIKNRFPLLDINWSRQHCLDYLAASGWESTPKSACIGCPFRTNGQWRSIRDGSPDEWADAIEFDKAIRSTDRYDGTRYLHRDLVPLDQAEISKLTRRERNGVQMMFGDPDEFTCSPFSCKGDDEDFLASLNDKDDRCECGAVGDGDECQYPCNAGGAA